MKIGICETVTKLFLAILAVLAVYSPGFSQPSFENYKLIWSDEFDGSGLPDNSNWSYEEGYVRNNELQYYTSKRLENTYVEDGFLTIEARKDNWDGHEYTSSSLHGRGKREFQYGIFEIRAKIDVRQGSWPAFWTLGANGEWPSNGEIDIMEYYAGKLHANVAWGTKTRWEASWDSETKAVGSDFSNDFHIWRMKWTKDVIELYVDDFLQNSTELSKTINGSDGKNPFQQKAYIMVNQAIGSNGGDPSSTQFPIKYIIDYVRVYQEHPDTVSPSIDDISASEDGSVAILFSEKLNKTAAENLSNYSINNGKYGVVSAKLQSDLRTVLLTVNDIVLNDSIMVTAKNISDNSEKPNILKEMNISTNVGLTGVKLTGTVIGKGTPWNNTSGTEYSVALDGNVSSYADCTGDTVYVGYDFGVDKKICLTGVRYYPRDEYGDRMINRSIEVSVDGKTWEKVYTIAESPQEKAFNVNRIAYSKPIRFVRYNGSGGMLNISEIEFWGYQYPQSSVSRKNNFFTNSHRMLSFDTPAKYTLYTLSGRVLESSVLNSHKSVLSTISSIKKKNSSVRNGLYMVEIRSMNNNKTIYKGLTAR